MDAKAKFGIFMILVVFMFFSSSKVVLAQGPIAGYQVSDATMYADASLQHPLWSITGIVLGGDVVNQEYNTIWVCVQPQGEPCGWMLRSDLRLPNIGLPQVDKPDVATPTVIPTWTPEPSIPMPTNTPDCKLDITVGSINGVRGWALEYNSLLDVFISNGQMTAEEIWYVESRQIGYVMSGYGGPEGAWIRAYVGSESITCPW